jgi:hypothetical protein
MKKKYYRIGFCDSQQGNPNDSELPIEIYIASQYISKLFYIFQGSGHGLMGAALTKDDLNNGFFRNAFIKCNCLWAIDLKEENFNDVSNIIFQKTGSLIEKEIRI